MKARPILFSGPMVRAILEGRKTQTRRTVKPQPPETHSFGGYVIEASPRKNEGKFKWGIKKNEYHFVDSMYARCPYGQPGDLLWVREGISGRQYAADMKQVPAGVGEQTWFHQRKRDYSPSIHMPRWASRLTLRITNIRVERLQDISNAEALAEGALEATEIPHIGSMTCRQARHAFSLLWESINGPGSWDENPWVWVIEFEPVQQNVGQVLAGGEG